MQRLAHLDATDDLGFEGHGGLRSTQGDESGTSEASAAAGLSLLKHPEQNSSVGESMVQVRDSLTVAQSDAESLAVL